MGHTRRIAAGCAALAVALAAPATGQAAGRHHGHAHHKRAPAKYYVSLGDSYASGYQPTHGSTTHGFANQLLPLARHRGHRYRLVNFGCGGATTTSIIATEGCAKPARALDGPRFRGRTQAAAAERFMRRHRKRIGLVTVSIGGNDVTACARDADPFGCVGQALGDLRTNVATLMKGVRRAAGPKARIVGITYPDVILGEWVRPNGNRDLATASVAVFKQLINPALKSLYADAGGRFVDVTAKTGAYGPLDAMTTLGEYGSIPVPVAKVCELTYYCQLGDIHPRTSGYHRIAKLIARTLPRKR